MIKVCTDCRHGEIMYKDLPSCPACKALDDLRNEMADMADRYSGEAMERDEDHS